MSKQEDLRRPEKPLEKTQEIDNEARISKKAELERKLNTDQERITLQDIQLFNILAKCNSIAIFRESLEYSFHHFLLPCTRFISRRTFLKPTCHSFP